MEFGVWSDATRRSDRRSRKACIEAHTLSGRRHLWDRVAPTEYAAAQTRSVGLRRSTGPKIKQNPNGCEHVRIPRSLRPAARAQLLEQNLHYRQGIELMGNSPRRVYIYPSLQQDNDIATNPFLPLGTIDDLSQSASPDYLRSYSDQSGGLLGMLLGRIQQGQDRLGVDSGVAPNNEPEIDSSYADPQSGLPGMLAAPQAGQGAYQPFAGSGRQVQSGPRDMNSGGFREFPWRSDHNARSTPINRSTRRFRVKVALKMLESQAIRVFTVKR
jgi:hypothetical protein